MDVIKELETFAAEEDKPPSQTPRPARPWRVAVIANLKGEMPLPEEAPADAGAEFDKPETIQAIQQAIESEGHHTVFLRADSHLPVAIQAFCPDICFNLAEGLGGDGREAQVPALLEMLHIPYTASRVVANAVALDKTMTKRLWREAGLPTAPFQEFVRGDEPLKKNLHFPLFVKPAREGTGMGLDGDSIVKNEKQLRARLRWLIWNYRQPALAESYLPGREFTVAVMGRPGAGQHSSHPEWYRADGYHRFHPLEVESRSSVTPGVYGNQAKNMHFGDEGIPAFICPARITRKEWEQLNTLAIRAHNAVGALDISRIDMRMDANGQPCLIEINTLPGMSPGFSDLCIIAEADGISYRDLILEILYLGASRYGMLTRADALPANEILEKVPARLKTQGRTAQK